MNSPFSTVATHGEYAPNALDECYPRLLKLPGSSQDEIEARTYPTTALSEPPSNPAVAMLLSTLVLDKPPGSDAGVVANGRGERVLDFQPLFVMRFRQSTPGSWKSALRHRYFLSVSDL
jgi:hypothetical protein